MMTDKIYLTQPLRPLTGSSNLSNKAKAKGKVDFAQILNEQLGVKFSKHAQERLNFRNIKLEAETLNKLNQAVEKAEAKGAKESLVLVDDVAFIVSIKNKTVITALDHKLMKDNVFTNIDSAVIA